MTSIDAVRTAIGAMRPVEALALGRELLARPEVASTPDVLVPLLAVHRGLDDVVPAQAAYAGMVASIRETAAHESARILGQVPTAGLAGHPVYERVGTIAGQLDLLDAVGALVHGS